MHWGSRWYPGAGLYRNVWLVKTPPVHVAQWGVFVTTPEITDAGGQVRLSVVVENQTSTEAAAQVEAEILGLDARGNPGKSVARAQPASASLAAGGIWRRAPGVP